MLKMYDFKNQNLQSGTLDAIRKLHTEGLSKMTFSLIQLLNFKNT